MTIPVAQAPVSHERGARRMHSRRRAVSAFSPLVDPEAERATGGKGMVMRTLSCSLGGTLDGLDEIWKAVERHRTPVKITTAPPNAP